MPPYQRNIQVYTSHTQPPSVVAGCNQHGTLTLADFSAFLRTVLVVGDPWRLYVADDNYLPLGDGLDPAGLTLLAVGNYVISSLNKQPIDVSLIAERHRPRTLSLDATGTARNSAFRERIRERDLRCCVTGQRVSSFRFHSFRASHIFPIAYKDMSELAVFVEDDAPDSAQGPNSMNSIQNGFLLRADVHAAFDMYELGINPDNGYRIHNFSSSSHFDGSMLWINQDVDPKYRPSDHLLREHFRQCLLANVRGVGLRSEDVVDIEDDFDLGDFDQWGQSIGDGGLSRLELELASRLNHLL